jgi:hypothetical protein
MVRNLGNAIHSKIPELKSCLMRQTSTSAAMDKSALWPHFYHATFRESQRWSQNPPELSGESQRRDTSFWGGVRLKLSILNGTLAAS